VSSNIKACGTYRYHCATELMHEKSSRKGTVNLNVDRSAQSNPCSQLLFLRKCRTFKTIAKTDSKFLKEMKTKEGIPKPWGQRRGKKLQGKQDHNPIKRQDHRCQLTQGSLDIYMWNKPQLW